jgi:hypothetical protein
MMSAETVCWDLSIFGLDKSRKSSQIFDDDIYLPFSLFFILWGMYAQEVPRAPDHRQLNLLPDELDLPAQLRQDQVGTHRADQRLLNFIYDNV